MSKRGTLTVVGPFGEEPRHPEPSPVDEGAEAVAWHLATCRGDVLTVDEEKLLTRRAAVLRRDAGIHAAALAEAQRSLDASRRRLRNARRRAVPVLNVVRVAQEAVLAAERDVAALTGDHERTNNEYIALRAHVVGHNIRFVRSLASETWSRPGAVVDREDLIQVGMVLMTEASDGFEPEQPNRLITFIREGIRHGLRTYRVEQSSPVLIGMKKRRAELAALAAQAMGISPVSGTGSARGTRGRRPDFAAALMTLASLDAAIFDDGTTRADLLIDDGAEDPAEAAVRKVVIATVLAVCRARLTPRERMILRRSFGLFGTPPEGLPSIALRLGVSPQRVHQIREQAFRKLRAAPELRALVGDLAVEWENPEEQAS